MDKYYYRPYRRVPIRTYGLSNFVGDAVLTCMTGGLWIVWIAVRELRNR